MIVADVGAVAVAAAGGGAAGVGVAVGVAVAHNNISGQQPNVYDTSLAPDVIDSVRSLATGDEVLVSAGYDPTKGVIGHLYRYIGGAAQVDLAQADYLDLSKWTDVGATPTYDTSLTFGQITKPVALVTGDTVRITASYVPTKGVVGDTYRYVGTAATRDLVSTDYTDASLWQLVYDTSRIQNKVETIASGDEVVIAPGFDSVKGANGAGAVGATYMYIAAVAAQLDLANTDYTDTTKWREVPTPKYDTSADSSSGDVKALSTGDLVRVAQGYDATKGVVGDTYRYLGGNAELDLASANYKDTSTWLDLGAIPPTYASTAGSTSLQTGDTVQVANGYDASKGVVGATYLYVGSAGTRDLASADYTDTSLWHVIDDTRQVQNKVETLITGDEVAVASDYDPTKGTIGHVYRYIGSAAQIDLARTDYLDTTKWTDVGPQEPKYDTVLADGAATKQVALTTGDQVRIADGYDPTKGVAGSVYLYIGSAATRDLANTDYTNTSIWHEIDSVGQVQAYVVNSSVDATGALSLAATSRQTIEAFVESAAGALSVGGVAGVSASGAGVSAVNTISVATRAYIDGEGVPGNTIVAGSISVTAHDTSAITAAAAAASVSVSFAGVAAVSVAIGVSLAQNTIGGEVAAYIKGVPALTTNGGSVTVSATDDATIKALSAAASVAASGGLVGLAFAGSGAVADNLIGVDTYAAISASVLGTSVHQVGAVTVSASDTSEIDAIVGAVAASVAGGFVGVGVAIGASVAHNTINDGRGGQGSVQAFLLSTSVQSSGALGLSASSNETIQAAVVAAAVGFGAGFVGVGAAGAGVETRNDVSVATRAYIDGQHNASIKAASVSATANDTSSITADAGAAVLSAAVGAVADSVSVGVATAHNTIADDVSSFIVNVDSGSTKFRTVQPNELVTIAPGYPQSKGVAGATYMYLGSSSASIDLANTDYTTGLWRRVSYDTALSGSPTKPVSLHNGDLVLISQAASGQPQADGIVGTVYRYIGASNTGSATTDLIAADYTDTTKWASAYDNAPTVVGNTTRNVTLQNGDLVLVSHAATGGVIGDLYRYIGPTNAGTSTTDLLAANYGDHTKWLDLGNPAAAATYDTSPSKNAQLQNGDLVVIKAAAPQADGVLGDVYRYIGPTQTGSARTDLLHADYLNTALWTNMGPFTSTLDTSLGTGLQTTSGGVSISATEHGSITARASAAAAAVSGGVVALGAAGAGADAANVVLNNTNAYLQSSAVNSHGGVALGATNTNSITAEILTAAASAAGSAFAVRCRLDRHLAGPQFHRLRRERTGGRQRRAGARLCDRLERDRGRAVLRDRAVAAEHRGGGGRALGRRLDRGCARRPGGVARRRRRDRHQQGGGRRGGHHPQRRHARVCGRQHGIVGERRLHHRRPYRRGGGRGRGRLALGRRVDWCR